MPRVMKSIALMDVGPMISDSGYRLIGTSARCQFDLLGEKGGTE